MSTNQSSERGFSRLAVLGMAVAAMGGGLAGGISVGTLLSPAEAASHETAAHEAATAGHADSPANLDKPFSTPIELAQPGDPMPVSMLTSDCLACHQVSFKVVGPAYQQVADKYRGHPEVARHLARKIIEGGRGVWGDVPMTPHPQFTLEQTLPMVCWVLGQIPPPPDENAGDAETIEAPTASEQPAQG